MLAGLNLKQTSTFPRELHMARSETGQPLPEPVIETLVAFAAEHPKLTFTVGSAHGLQRDTQFFRNYQNYMRFFDRNGNEFTFDDNARPIRKNEPFVGVAILPKTQSARVYARFR